MVVLSVALCTRGGKPVLARQFVELPRMRIESLLASFPKLVSPSKQHTYVESDSVRYVFQPMETLYLLMVTTKNANIVEDLDTLRLLSKVVTDACPQVSEEAVVEAAFELVAAFDEVISLGYRESISLAGIRANLEMNSHEEKLSLMIRQSKEIEAKQEMKRQAAFIRAKKAAESSSGPGGPGKMQGFGSSGSYMPPSASSTTFGNSASTTPQANKPAPPSSPTTKSTTALGAKKGMQLGKKQKDVLEAVAQEDGMDADELSGVKLTSTAISAPGAVAVPKEPVHVIISETVSATIMQDGSLNSYVVAGQVQLVSCNENAKFNVQLTSPSSLFKFTPHPQLDKIKWDKSSLIQLKQEDRALPTNTAFGALRYRSNKVEDVSEIPLSLTVWPEAGKGGVTNVNIEFELHGEVDLHNVTIVIPLGSQEAPVVKQASIGTHRHNSRRQQLEWVIDSISSDTATGNFEFDLAKSDPASFFPTVVSFTTDKSLAGLTVSAVTNLVDGTPIRFGTETTVTTDAYEVVSEE